MKINILQFKSKPVTHEARILQHLRKCGKYGSFNYELAKPNVGGLAWHRRITDLRKEGYNITLVRIKRGVNKYFLNQENA